LESFVVRAETCKQSRDWIPLLIFRQLKEGLDCLRLGAGITRR
jgi:hypothetical protein